MLSSSIGVESPEIEASLQKLEKQLSTKGREDDYYQLLRKWYVKLKNRVSNIIRHIEFDRSASGKQLLDAIEHYRLQTPAIKLSYFIPLMNKIETHQLGNGKHSFNQALCKCLFYQKVSVALKSGELNLKNSYRYKSVYQYLIPEPKWKKERTELIRRAGLEKFEKVAVVIKKMEENLQGAYQQTNRMIREGKNPYISFDKDGKVKTPHTPKVDKPILNSVTDLFRPCHYTSILKILKDIDGVTNFSDCFQHHQPKYQKGRPSLQTLMAGILGYGCNIGIQKMGKTSKGINLAQLETAINWFFSLQNIREANDRILEVVAQLELPKLFKKQPGIYQTSSDGQKFKIGVDSLNANYSYKYGGNEKAVTAYDFIDEAFKLFYVTVISASEREAAYVIDGLLNNEDLYQSEYENIHSTDTHGFSEMIFAVTHLLGITFAPRIKRVKDQVLYGFALPKGHATKDYRIRPARQINTEHFEGQWENVLRLVATIRLKEAPASIIFKRLSSYSLQHPLYKALKEFGRITKSQFILRYYNDVKFRQLIQAQLNKIELAHRFAKAVFHGNNQEVMQELKDDQDRVKACRVLIQNTIILWNYLYLTKEISKAETREKKQELIATIKNGSILTWEHVNLQGIYDFESEITGEVVAFELDKLLKVEVA